ncbi:hypothetical protein LTR84_009584 [Exophiala bonariae]|uniref:Major facilitator superfamily (MFS) profile domain-containing protein n=1 Tax=Exophiala bonariae TaxID=1690606 RepID=A0AAV9NME9_9EURO|nr:hypothetical protein LTR84_009584 [Exophiala bonariae]
MDSHLNASEKQPDLISSNDDETPNHLERIPTIEQNNYHGLTPKCIIVYLAVLFVGFAQMMVIVTSGLLTRSMVADIGGQSKSQWMSQTVPIINLALGSPVAQAADYWGRKWPMFVSCVLAIVGCVIVSRATNIETALAGNVLASSSTGTQPLLFAIASEILPRRFRPAAQGGLTGIFAIGAIVALLMGSAVTNHSIDGWRIVWYFTTGLFAFAGAAFLFLYNPPSRFEQVNFTLSQKLKRLDWVGIIVLPVSVTVFVIGLTWSDNPYSWKNGHVLGPFIVGIVLLLALVGYEAFVKKDGLFNHKLFRHDRNFSIALFLIFVEGMAFFVANTFLPLEVSVLYSTNPIMVGFNFSIVFICATVSTILASIYCSWSRSLRWPVVMSYSGFVLFYGRYTPKNCQRITDKIQVTMLTLRLGDSKNVYGYPVFLGLGLGGCLTLVVVAAQFSAPPELLAIGSGALITARSFGAAICLPIANAIFSSQISKNLPHEIAEAVLPLGVSPENLGLFIQALSGHDSAVLGAIPGVTPQIIGAGAHALQHAYLLSLRPVHAFGLAVSAIAVIGKY